MFQEHVVNTLINEYLQVSYISFGLGLDGRNANFVGILGTVLRCLLISNTNPNSWLNDLEGYPATVDGRNPAPPDMYETQ